MLSTAGIAFTHDVTGHTEKLSAKSIKDDSPEAACVYVEDGADPTITYRGTNKLAIKIPKEIGCSTNTASCGGLSSPGRTEAIGNENFPHEHPDESSETRYEHDAMTLSGDLRCLGRSHDLNDVIEIVETTESGKSRKCVRVVGA